MGWNEMAFEVFSNPNHSMILLAKLARIFQHPFVFMYGLNHSSLKQQYICFSGNSRVGGKTVRKDSVFTIPL